MSDIFISYATEDRPRVEPLGKILEAKGWSVWWDRHIPPGKAFDEVIEEAIDAARCVVVVWTSLSVKSRWVRTEAGEGLSRHILVPVLLDDIRIPLAFRRIQAAKILDWDGASSHPGLDQLVDAVSSLLETPEQTVQQPQALPDVPDESSRRQPSGEKTTAKKKQPTSSPSTLSKKKLLHLLEGLRKYEKVYFDPDIPEYKLSKARKVQRISRTEKVLALLDLTFFGGAKESILFSSRAFYHRNLGTERTAIAYRDFPDHLFTAEVGGIRLDGEYTLAIAGILLEVEILVDVLNAIRDEMIERRTPYQE